MRAMTICLMLTLGWSAAHAERMGRGCGGGSRREKDLDDDFHEYSCAMTSLQLTTCSRMEGRMVRRYISRSTPSSWLRRTRLVPTRMRSSLRSHLALLAVARVALSAGDAPRACSSR